MLDLSKYVNQRKTLQTEINTLVSELEERFNDVSLDAFDIMELIDADELNDTVSFDVKIFRGLAWINDHHQAKLEKELNHYAQMQELSVTFDSCVDMGAYSTNCDVTVECEIKDFIKVASHFINLHKEEGDEFINSVCEETMWAIYEMDHNGDFGYELSDEEADGETIETRLDWFIGRCEYNHGMDTLTAIEYMENNYLIDEDIAKGITEAVKQLKFKATLAEA